jgi:hypothetical protein
MYLQVRSHRIWLDRKVGLIACSYVVDKETFPPLKERKHDSTVIHSVIYSKYERFMNYHD